MPSFLFGIGNRTGPAACWAAAAVALILGASSPIVAQQGTVRGQVTDAVTQRPIVGAQVSVVGTPRGTVTNSSGEFVISNVPVGTQTVRVDNIGFRTAEESVEITADQTATVSFGLSQAAIDLEQIVVTGTVGETQRRAVGNSVSSLSTGPINEASPIQSVNELLQGRVAGLTVMSNSGIAGTASKIRIRGASSLEAGNDPVVYVDGVRITSGALAGMGTNNSVVQHTNALQSINPEDVESIEVIKGPAAATLYGAEAAAGVIQIITKKGRALDRGIEWSLGGEVGQEEWALDRVTTYWTCTEEEISDTEDWPGCEGVAPGTVVTDHPLDRDIAAENLANFGTECQWIQNCVSPNALRTADVWNTRLSARGGGDAYNFYVSGERSDQQGVFHNNFARRSAGRANFGFVPGEKLNFSANVSFTRGDQSQPLSNNSSNSILRNGMRGRPPAAPDWTPGYRNFSPELANEWSDRIRQERTTIGLTTNFQPFSWWRNRLTVGLDKLERTNELFLKIDRTGREPFGAVAATGSIDRDIYETHQWTVDYSGSVITAIGTNYQSTFSAGMQLNANRFRLFETSGEGLVADKLNLISGAAVTTAGEDREEQTSLGFFFQEELGWRDRLYATAALRVDDNSAFGEDFSLVYYPKAHLAWVISEESFFNVPHIDDLKLRAAWGRAGNAPDPFSADRTLAADVTTVGDEAVNFVEFDAYGNPNLKAETGQEIEVGFDLSAFSGRLGADLTYYYQQTKDALIPVPAPPSTGFPNTFLINVGEVRNSGLELLLRGTPIYTRNVVWDASLSFSTNSNELASFGRDEDGNPLREEISFGAFAEVQKHREGYPLGGYWSQDVVRDENGTPILDDGDAILEDELEFVGPMLPTREVGFSSTVTLFGNLQLFAALDYKGGNYQWCAICSIRSRIDQNTKELHDPNTTPEERARLLSLQTQEWIMPADFIKLRDVSATYTLPSQWVGRFGAQRVSLSLGARNLWMWTRYDGTSDPEQVFDGNAEFSQADYAGSPMTRRISLSTRIVF